MKRQGSIGRLDSFKLLEVRIFRVRSIDRFAQFWRALKWEKIHTFTKGSLGGEGR